MADAPSEIELRPFNQAGEDGAEAANARELEALAPADGGLQAWLFLGAAFFLEALAWGFPFTFGLFEDYYSTHAPFASQSANAPAIGTTQMGLMYFLAPLLSFGLARFPYLRRSCIYGGLVLLEIGLIGASFAESVEQLLATQGVLYGLGGGMLYFPVIAYLDEWFVRRRGFAYGIMWAGSGASGIVLPYTMDWLLKTYGFRTTLRVWAVAMALLIFPFLFFIKPRIPLPARKPTRAPSDEGNGVDQQPQRAPSPRPPIDLGFLSTTSFWVFQAGNIFMNLGYFMPSIYIPSYARSQGFGPDPRTIGTTAISLYNLATVLGAVAMGLLVDRFNVVSITLASSLSTAAVVMLLWGFAVSPAVLYVFAISYGILCGGFSVTWSGCAAVIRTQMEKHRGQGAGANVQTAMVVSMFAAGKGIGAVVSGPLSTRLLELTQTAKGAGGGLGAYGTSYEGIVVFTGVSTCLGGIAWFGRLLGIV